MADVRAEGCVGQSGVSQSDGKVTALADAEGGGAGADADAEAEAEEAGGSMAGKSVRARLKKTCNGERTASDGRAIARRCRGPAPTGSLLASLQVTGVSKLTVVSY